MKGSDMLRAVLVFIFTLLPLSAFAEDEGGEWVFMYLGDVEHLDVDPGVYKVESVELSEDNYWCYVSLRRLSSEEISTASYEGYAADGPDSRTWFELPNEIDLVSFQTWKQKFKCTNNLNELPTPGSSILFRYTKAYEKMGCDRQGSWTNTTAGY